MRILLLTIVCTLILSSLSAQWGDNHIKLSHNIKAETKAITGFSKIDVTEDFLVYLRCADTEEVIIEANENLHDLINVEQHGETLKIFTDPYSYSYDSRKGKKGSAKEKLVAYITAKQITGITAEEDVIIELKGKLIGEELTIDLNEDSALDGELEVKNLIVNLNEDSILDIEGSAQTMKAKADEDSIIKSFDFVVGNLELDLNEDSQAKLTVNGDIDLRAREDSFFYHKGPGTFTRKKLTGDSKVKKR